MLAELMKTLHLTPKEFVKGKMHIPAYRTLYLDQMLESNENIYANRDRHFREIVKGFKTIHDADFEEPESLSRICLLYTSFGILLCHPATKDIKWFLRLIIGCCLSLIVPMCACCQFTDIKVP